MKWDMSKAWKILAGVVIFTVLLSFLPGVVTGMSIAQALNYLAGQGYYAYADPDYNWQVTGDTSIGGDLDVTGDGSFGGTLQVSGANVTRSATFIIAASDSPSSVKAMADYLCDGTADDVEIQAAVNAISSTQGGKILLMAGNYSCSENITITYAGTTVEGESWPEQYGDPSGASLTFAANKSGFIVPASVHGAYFKNLRLIGNSASQSTNGIRLTNENDMCKVENVIIGTFGKGIYATDCDSLHLNTARCVGNFNNLYFDGSSRNEVSAYNGYFNEAVGTSICFVSGTAKIQFTKNEILGTTNYYGVSANGTLFGNFSENRFEDGQSGIYLKCTVMICEITDNFFTDHDNYSVHVAGNSVNVSNNIIYNTTKGVLFNGNRCTASGNQLSTISSYGIALYYSQNCRVFGNTLNSVTSPFLIDNDTDSLIYGNYGFITENSGTTTITNGNASIDVAHGLDVTPDEEKIIVLPMEDMDTVGSNGFYVPNTANSTHFQIFSSGNVTDDMSLGWSYSRN